MGASADVKCWAWQIGPKLLTLSDMIGHYEINPDTLDTVGRCAPPNPFNPLFAAAVAAAHWRIGSSVSRGRCQSIHHCVHICACRFYYADETPTKPLNLTEKFEIITCAHPSQLPGDKYVYNYLLEIMGNMPKVGAMHMYRMYRVDTTVLPLRREVVFSMPVDVPAYMHQFAHTPNYIVYFEYSLHWNVMQIATALNILPHMVWSNNSTRVVVIDKRTWTVTNTFYTDAVFGYHLINSYEDGDAVVVDIMLSECNGAAGQPGGASCNDMNKFNLATLKNDSWPMPKGKMVRYNVPVGKSTEALTYKVMNQYGMDLLAIHPKLKGYKHRYVWSLATHGDGVWWNNIIKIDMETLATIEWYKEDHYPSEVSFFPRPGATDEDDGVLVSTVLGAPLGRSYLLILDAKTLTEIATADAPHYLPFPSHGHSCAPIDGEQMCWWA